MAQYNPMLDNLQQKIEDYNENVQSTIDRVANRQKLITIGVVLINLLVLFLTNHFLPDDRLDASKRLITFLSNRELNIIITIVSISVTLPAAALLGRKKFHELKINEDVIEPRMQYAGEWEYKTTFRMQSQDDGSEEYKRCKDNMDGYPEHGLCKWTQNIFELKIEYANTEASKPTDKTSKPQISWQSSPISYDENEVRWSFNGKIWWKDEKNFANEFSGIEFYRVRESDAQGRPSYLEGRLIGTVLVGEHFFVVDAVSSFTRKG